MQRLDEILKLVSEFEKIDVNSLSEKLQVSKVTNPKDYCIENTAMLF